jgi:putative long chain acyl-CoA synthase
MFMGSGMPRNLWRRVNDRFPSTKVLEFYASAEGEAILANLSGRAVGSMGKPLPGTAEVRVARCVLSTGALILDADGLAGECSVDEVGLLLARVDPADPGSGAPLRGVFERGDAWRSTGDLFLRDEHGDLWLAGSVAEVVATTDGPALPSGTRFALSSVPCVDLVVAYGVRDGDSDVLVGAFTLRPDTEISAGDIDKAMSRLPAAQRPRYLQRVPSIPVTTWHRPLWRPLQAGGVPTPNRTRTVWRLADDRGHYEQLT